MVLLRTFLLLNTLYLFTLEAFPQSTLVPLFTPITISCDRNYISKDSAFHTAVKPYLYAEIKNNKLIDSLIGPGLFSANNSFLLLPIVDVQLGKGTGRSSLLEYTAGLTLAARLGKKWSASITGLAGNLQLINYLDSFATKKNVIPNFGYAYRNNNGYSFQSLSGYVSYSPSKLFNFQVGKDKHFWGDGYRSLFLSDNSNNFPFIKLSASVWKIKYVSLFAWQKHTSYPAEFIADAKNKFGSFHLLSWNITKRININLFEAIVWQGSDTSRSRSFDVNYLNPVIFYRPVEYSIGSSDNALVGGGFKIKLFKKQQLYSQIMLDEFLLKEVLKRSGWWANKYSVQIGYKFFDLLNINNLYFQAEFNYVRPYTYAHASAQQNYAHFNQALAHPLGANFKEKIGIITYTYKRWHFQGRLVTAVYGLDTSAAGYGKNIYISYKNRAQEFGNITTQGLKTNLNFIQVSTTYLLKPAYNMRFEAGIIYRSETNAFQNISSNLLFIGIKTSLFNTYRDF